ncbi:Holliday junction resolvase RuvX [Aureimonas fodinaquatilis]|uniref:Putative pre-16S rRNA nuclease n=1 Tax=Aureimonas fodinaquatilis TaxID=2565783 RepID=A0A5B0DUX2_9HYPH|nr:Holliday junction resolvase RuvX [Aureimonas fodinaquatilis]KAA0970138.1 Holliday junction resolvase RuvX [Aureimonas fodinaquatilis]
MAVVDIAEIKSLLLPNTVIAGLDLGTKTIGLAVSDLGLRFATPRPVLKRTRFSDDAAALAKMLDEARCSVIIIGLPLNMDGTEGPRSQATRAFVRNYGRGDARPVVFWDERLSTVAAERTMIDADLSRKKRAERIDSAAAAFILQGALDRMRHLNTTATNFPVDE